MGNIRELKKLFLENNVIDTQEVCESERESESNGRDKQKCIRDYKCQQKALSNTIETLGQFTRLKGRIGG